MTIYVAKIQLDDIVVEMPPRKYLSLALLDLKELEERYEGVPHGSTWICEY